MIKIVKKIGFCLFCVVILITAAFTILFFNEINSLSSLRIVDNYPMYQMKYCGDYGFDEFLKVGAENDSDIEKFVTRKLLKGLPIDLGINKAGCTAFKVKNEKGEVLLCRNFDFDYAPSLQIKTEPKDGFKSISTVNLTFAGYSKGNLPKEGVKMKNFLTLASPYLPFDGMNENGVAMALLAVPEVNVKDDKDKVKLNTTTAIRLVLDKAKNVDEAVELLKKYNIYFSADVYCHYIIADAEGNSVIVEYWDGKLQTIKSVKDYQIASNFISYNNLNIGEGGSEFDRYNTVEKVINDNNGVLTQKQAEKLLMDVGCYNSKGENKLQWSVIYNLTTRTGEIFAYRNNKNVINFELK